MQGFQFENETVVTFIDFNEGVQRSGTKNLSEALGNPIFGGEADI